MESSISEDDPAVLASCLTLLARTSADLAIVIESWDDLPEVIRAGILALVKSTIQR